jgi:hypothetical protein
MGSDFQKVRRRAFHVSVLVLSLGVSMLIIVRSGTLSRIYLCLGNRGLHGSTANTIEYALISNLKNDDTHVTSRLMCAVEQCQLH